MKKRGCLECACDISHRYKNAIRCEKCAKERRRMLDNERHEFNKYFRKGVMKRYREGLGTGDLRPKPRHKGDWEKEQELIKREKRKLDLE